ncbi:MAG: hypothetical protein J6X60_05305 [Ruminiclostridium sp.]|nr:hypothetical protein [Ruminiclostridium sp.]
MSTERVNAESYKCPGCGAPLSYSAETKDFYCPFCGGHFGEDRLEMPTVSLDDGPVPENLSRAKQQFADETKLYLCPNCGASLMTDSVLDATTECLYCHSPIVLSGRLQGDYRPDMVIPFLKTKQDAIDGFKKWIEKKKKYLAHGFGSEQSIHRIQGIYIPFWMADCHVDGEYVGYGFKETGRKNRGKTSYVIEKQYLVIRKGKVAFSGVLADGSSRCEDSVMDSIEPFDYSGLKEFDPAYLSGHAAERYDVSWDDVLPRIHQRIKEAATKEFRNSVIGYDRITDSSSDFRIGNISKKYIMLPVWLMTFFYNDRLYFFAMNGQTGKIGGALPINRLKVLLRAIMPVALPILIGIIFAILNYGFFCNYGLFGFWSV